MLIPFGELALEGKSLIVGLTVFLLMRLANATLPKGYHFKFLDRFLTKDETKEEEEEEEKNKDDLDSK